MRISLHYAEGRLPLDIPDSFSVTEFQPETVATPVAVDDFRLELDAHDFSAVFESAQPLIVVNDGYRNTPTTLVLEWLDAVDDSLLDRADFLIATGTHAPPTEDHYRKIFGSFLDRCRSRVSYHEADNSEAMVKLADDPRAGEVFIHHLALERKPILIIGSVEPHYFAGFTGGRKSLVPGLVDLATTERNHNLAGSLDAAPLKLAGNPVAEHLDQLMEAIDLTDIYSIQVVLDAAHNPAGVFCGGLTESFSRATGTATEIYSHRLERPCDVLIAEMRPPLDRNLYQLQKAVENCQAAVADGGTLIVVSACPEGVGSPHFYGLAERWDPASNAPRDGQLSFGSHKLSRVISIQKRIDVVIYSEVHDTNVRKVFYEPLDNVQEFLYSRQNVCEKCNVVVVYDAGHTVVTT